VPKQKSSSARASHRLIGFLRVNRSSLVISVSAFAVVAIGIQQLPDPAVAQEAVLRLIAAQSVDVPTRLALPADVDRGAFMVTTFTTVQWPVDPSSRIGDRFGYRSAPCAGCSSFHHGTDFDSGLGTPVAAIANGVVTEVGNPSGDLGVHVVIRHSIDGVTFSSVYGHMELGSMHLVVGQTVTRGQLIGLVGETGEATGPHLHFGIENAAGTDINSLTWIRKYANVPYVSAR
jgi:murein DD-endopeptidase MepM/ murein hydrolase activator NlpD